MPQNEKAAEINLELGIEHLRKGNLQQAKDKIDRSLEQNPRYGRAHLVAGMLYNRLGDENKAESHYERAVSLEPKNPEFKNNYAVYLCQHNKFERGKKVALEAAADQLYKTPEVAYMNAGNCARSAGDMKGAEEYFRQVARGEAALQRSVVPDGGARISADRIHVGARFPPALHGSGSDQSRQRCGWECASSAGSATRHRRSTTRSASRPNIRPRPRPKNCWSPSGIRDE